MAAKTVRKRSAPTTASLRLKQDYMRLMKDPVPYIVATPKMDNILEWHYVVAGPENSPYEGGYYHGKLVFPQHDFHPDTWNPAWSVSTILTGLLSFMLEDQPTLGSVTTTKEVKRAYAMQSLAFNLGNTTFCELFPDLAQELREEMESRMTEGAAGEGNVEDVTAKTVNSAGDNSTMMNHMVLLGAVALLAYLAHTVLNSQDFNG